MKKALFTLILGAFAFAGSAQELTSGPMISLNKDTHDYGTIKMNADGNCEFMVTNTGTEPLIMSNCKGTCGCTVPKCEKNPIMPGESSAIKVAYDTKRVGPINKSVTITSNAVNDPTKVIRIKGTVEGDPTGGTAPVKETPGLAPINK